MVVLLIANLYTLSNFAPHLKRHPVHSQIVCPVKTWDPENHTLFSGTYTPLGKIKDYPPPPRPTNLESNPIIFIGECKSGRITNNWIISEAKMLRIINFKLVLNQRFSLIYNRFIIQPGVIVWTFDILWKKLLQVFLVFVDLGSL